jgi:hypothetical protein
LNFETGKPVVMIFTQPKEFSDQLLQKGIVVKEIERQKKLEEIFLHSLSIM